MTDGEKLDPSNQALAARAGDLIAAMPQFAEESRGVAPNDRDPSTSMQIKLALLQALGIPVANVCDVELDLSDTIAMLKVAVAVPAWVNGLIVQEVQQFELVSRSQEVPE